MSEIMLASVKFINTGKVYYFSTDLKLNKGDSVVVHTARGIELGEISKDLENIEKFNLNTQLKKITRKATKHDLENFEANKLAAQDALAKCHQAIENQGLDMHLTSCEYTLDRSKVIFMYTADKRVDFRNLLKELAGIFRCRIELKQIGARDKAKIIGGMGTCGMPLCCSNLLGEFNGVSINMAKNQMLAINVDKISGACGRLMCCLKYEDDLYSEAKKKFPRLGAMMKYDQKKVKVIGINVISDTVKIKDEDNILTVNLSDLKRVPVNKERKSGNKNGRKKRSPKHTA